MPKDFNAKTQRNIVKEEKNVVKTRAFPASSPSLSICWAMAKDATAQGAIAIPMMEAAVKETAARIIC